MAAPKLSKIGYSSAKIEDVDSELLQLLKANWNQILDAVLAENRIAWLAFFDARLSAVRSGTPPTLVINFQDSDKFAVNHDFTAQRNQAHIDLLLSAINTVTGISAKLEIQ
jgi:hypothetical protein